MIATIEVQVDPITVGIATVSTEKVLGLAEEYTVSQGLW